METRVVNIFKEPYDVYIGRAGKGQDGDLGNPFKLQPNEPKGATKEKFEKYFYERIEKDTEFKEKVLSLKGKRIGCFCKQPNKEVWCHGDVYVEYLKNM